MDAFVDLGGGFATALTPTNLAFALLGVLLGTAIGVLPGIGPAMAVALLLPLTRGLDVTTALIMFAGIYYGTPRSSAPLPSRASPGRRPPTTPRPPAGSCRC